MLGLLSCSLWVESSFGSHQHSYVFWTIGSMCIQLSVLSEEQSQLPLSYREVGVDALISQVMMKSK